MKPIIGITTYETDDQATKLSNTYINAVFKAGGIPILIPYVQEDEFDKYIDLVDGIIFSGGIDVLPYLFGEDPIVEAKHISIDRDNSEVGLFKRAYERKMPILGICRGMQLANVVLGGSLYQDIFKQVPNVIGHDPAGSTMSHGYHAIELTEGSMMKDIFGQEKIMVNSHHHESVKEVGENLVVTSRTSDGLAESIEATDDRFLLGLQFHPEALVNNYPEFLGIFERFVEESKNYNK